METLSTIQDALRDYWGFDSFLPLQKDAMECALCGRDSVVVLPTGGGKSLCFQVPAVMLPGLTVVVSPLISLMKDQVDALQECGVPAARFDSTLTPAERRDVTTRVTGGTLKLLYLEARQEPAQTLQEIFIPEASRQNPQEDAMVDTRIEVADVDLQHARPAAHPCCTW